MSIDASYDLSDSEFIIPTETFEASWTNEIIDLDETPKTTLEKIQTFMTDFVFYIPRTLMRPIINLFIIPKSSKTYFPSGILLAEKFIQEMNRCFDHAWKTKGPGFSYFDINTWQSRLFSMPNVIKSYEAIELDLKTPDGIKLGGHFFKHMNFDKPNSRIMLVFGGNGEFYKTGVTLTWLMKDLHDLKDIPISFLTVNLRGCESSEGTPSNNGLILDADTLYQYALKQVDNDSSRIDIFGHSLGGTITTQLKSKHPNSGGLTFISRTFYNIIEQGKYLVARDLGGSWISRLAGKILISSAKMLGWKYNNIEAAKKITDKVHIFHHELDDTIPPKTSLAQKILDEQLTEKNFVIHTMQDSVTAFRNRVHFPSHVASLDLLQEETTNKTGLAIIVEALKRAAKKCEPKLTVRA